MSDIAHALFSLGDWKAKAGKCERPRRSTRKSADAKMGPRGPASIRRFWWDVWRSAFGVRCSALWTIQSWHYGGVLLAAPGGELPALLPRESNTPTRRHVYFPSGSSGAVFGSVTVVRAAFMIMARNV